MLVTLPITNARHVPATVSGFCVAAALYSASLVWVILDFCITPVIKDGAYSLLTLQQALLFN